MGADRGVNDDIRRPEYRSSPLRRLLYPGPFPQAGGASGARQAGSAARRVTAKRLSAVAHP
ncbi:TPA: hypothetical protein L6B08_02130 [Pseudomonas aeruginosa]|uniref:Uncharacterized protein n=1 Tax=Pseudomonas aeruginosa TaxID=287 RepID=A0ABD7KAR0_PSEAI|nr:hypothetical protein IPC434_04990 [Pseudomonas aeruginosa]RTS02086.1 hypothetical protein DY932_03580 [Pseudomonas paraeruginosa]RTS51895.1 hypothetical protein DY940_03580 [Pseudomonas aeruginosa]HBP6037998.1 hypothetical protein [Pseudomonas aeruginosa]HBP6459063.1 hypothetical protein [Pseudomonas aeruginosa]